MKVITSSLVACSLLLSSISPAVAARIPTAADVYEAAITYAEEKNILEPMSDGLMHPEMPISRQDIVVSIVRDVYGKDIRPDCFDRIAANLPARFTHLFTDVSLTNTNAKELCVGMFVGLVEGQKDGSFAPQAGANLVDAAKIVSKAYGIAPLPSLEVENNVPWHEPFWFALARKNAIPESVKNRSSMLTRGEFAEILYRLRDERPTQGFRYKPTMVKDIAQGTKNPSEVTDSFIDPTVSVLDSVVISTHESDMSDGLKIQMHVEERRASRLQKAEMNAVSMQYLSSGETSSDAIMPTN